MAEVEVGISSVPSATNEWGVGWVLRGEPVMLGLYIELGIHVQPILQIVPFWMGRALLPYALPLPLHLRTE